MVREQVLKSHSNFKEIFKDVFNGIGCFDGMFSLQLKPGSKPYQVPPRHVAYALQKPFKEELEWLQKQDIITLLGMYEAVECGNNFVLVPKSNGKVRLCLDPARLNQALIRPMHRGPTLHDILPKLNNAQYLSLIDESSYYHNLKLDEKSSYLTRFACQFGRYRWKRLPFRAAPAGDMFQWKSNEIFEDLPDVFDTADDILVVGYEADGKDHDKTLWRVLQMRRQVNLKLNKGKCHFRCTSVPCFGEIISRYGVKPDPRKLKVLMEMPPRNSKHSWV